MKKASPPPVKAKYRKILLYCGIPLGVVIIVLLGVLLYSYVVFRQFRKDCTEDKPAVIKHEAVNQAQQAKLNAKYHSIREVIKDHKKARLQFTSEEFSQLIAYSPETRGIADKAKFWLEGDKIKADLSISLDSVPNMKGRHLNGLFTFSVAFQDQKIRLHIDECIVKGRPMSPSYLKLLNSQDLVQTLSRQGDTSWMNYIDNLEINDGKLVIDTR